MDENLRNRWPSVAVLATAVGFAVWLMVGEPRIAAVVALSAALLATILNLTRDRAGEYYMIAAVAVVMGFVTTRCGTRRSGPDPWQDLAREFANREPAAGIERYGDIHLVRHTGEFMVQRFRFRRARVSFDGGAMFLTLSWPQTLAYDGLRVPVRRLTSCERGERDSYGRVVLRIGFPPVDVVVADPDDRVLGWCREQNVAGH